MDEDEQLAAIVITVCQGPPLCDQVYCEDDPRRSDERMARCKLCRIEISADDGETWTVIQDPVRMKQ